MERIITVIDLGSNKIAACACAIDRAGRTAILALENLCSRSVNGGNITDINRAVEDISSIMRKIERHERKKEKRVYVTIKGVDAELHMSRGLVPLSKTPRVITRIDVKRCLDIASMIRLPEDRVIVQTAVRGFRIDGGEIGVKNPIGLYGIKLEAESFIVTVSLSMIQNITKCIDHSGFLLEGVYLSGLASADSVLDMDEKEKGVVLFDIGDTLTEALFFKNGMLTKRYIIRKGANALMDRQRHVSKDALTEFFRDASLVRAAGEPRFNRGEYNFSSAVLTGGGALLDGIIEEAEKALGTPVRVGLAKPADYNLDLQNAIIHTATLGLIDQIAKEYKVPQIAESPFRKILHNLFDIYETYF